MKVSKWHDLYKLEDWLAVWIGFFIIGVFLLGLRVDMPKFKWTLDSEFQALVSENAPVVDKVTQQAGEKGETALLEAATTLKAAMVKMDRKDIAGAAKKVEDEAKKVKDGGLKKRAGDVGKDLRGQAGNLASKVFTWDNSHKAIHIGIAFLLLSLIAMALMGQPILKFIAGFPLVFVIAWVAQFIAGITPFFTTAWNTCCGVSSWACS